VHAQWCVVFAQLLIGNKNQGIHGFLVRWVVVGLCGNPGLGSRVCITFLSGWRLWLLKARCCHVVALWVCPSSTALHIC
jgi:hypothetical protein